MRLRSLPLCMALIAVTVALGAGASVAEAATFNQSGNTVRVSTVQTAAAWTVAVNYSDTTQTAVPSGDEALLRTYTVPAGQTEVSIVLPREHRRYRFDVQSVRPATSHRVMWSYAGSFSGEDVLGERPQWRVMRGGVRVMRGYFGGGEPNGFLWTVGMSGGVLAGDLVQVGSELDPFTFTQIGAAFTMPDDGQLGGNADMRLTVSPETGYWTATCGRSVWLDVTVPQLDDGGIGVFENPTYANFIVDTGSVPPTITIETSSSGVATGSISVGSLGGLDTPGIDALLALLGFTCGVLTGKAVLGC